MSSPFLLKLCEAIDASTNIVADPNGQTRASSWPIRTTIPSIVLCMARNEAWRVNVTDFGSNDKRLRVLRDELSCRHHNRPRDCRTKHERNRHHCRLEDILVIDQISRVRLYNGH